MKQILCTLALGMVLNFTANAQDKSLHANAVTELTATMVSNQMLITWLGETGEGTGDFWQVQASADGKNFKTIGYVLGSQNNKAMFKYKIAKTKAPGYYRVLSIINAETAFASDVVKM